MKRNGNKIPITNGNVNEINVRLKQILKTRETFNSDSKYL